MSSNFMAWSRGVIFHLPWVNMHQKNSNHVGYHHIEGFQDCFIYKEDRYAKTIDTRDESPCTLVMAKSVRLCFRATLASPCLQWTHRELQLWSWRCSFCAQVQTYQKAMPTLMVSHNLFETFYLFIAFFNWLKRSHRKCLHNLKDPGFWSCRFLYR